MENNIENKEMENNIENKEIVEKMVETMRARMTLKKQADGLKKEIAEMDKEILGNLNTLDVDRYRAEGVGSVSIVERKSYTLTDDEKDQISSLKKAFEAVKTPTITEGIRITPAKEKE